MINEPLSVLVSAYACGPNWGSEVGMGWNWVVNLSNYCKLTVITEIDFKKSIEEKISEMDITYQPEFHYIDVGKEGRKLFWKQGSYSFYAHYRKWQKDALELAKNLVREKDFNIIHQLNMIGYREPGYLWQIQDRPYIIGPLGGFNQFPYAYFSVLNFRDKLFYLARNIINVLQMKFLQRPKKAYKRADYVILATSLGMDAVSKYSKKTPIVIPETGAYPLQNEKAVEHKEGEKLIFTWIGHMAGRKTLPIAIKSIANVKNRDKVMLNVIGDGPNSDKCRKLVDQLNLDNVVWYGEVPNVKAKKIIAKSDMLFFTSILDATSTVIFEALEADIPVLCHNTCGFGEIIDETCGIEIPMVNPRVSIKLFSQAIDDLVEHPQKIKTLKTGCHQKVKDHYWSTKGAKMHDIYLECLKN